MSMPLLALGMDMEIIVEGQAYIGCSLSQVFKQLHFCLCTNCVDQIPCETMSRSTHASAHQCLMFSCTWETVHSDRPLYGRSELEICRFGVLCSGTGCLALIFAMPLLSVSLQEPVSPALKLVRAARPVLRGVQWLANRAWFPSESTWRIPCTRSPVCTAILAGWLAGKIVFCQCDCRDAASDSEDSDSWYLPQAKPLSGGDFADA
ncbi:unnamed protein product [Durusdinium trenchii]|uniref:Uncharacterized protein n=1 Tax=Durusdinium trenchii TaxID=1381693 RepID=A0ABP0SYR3_9DINO